MLREAEAKRRMELTPFDPFRLEDVESWMLLPEDLAELERTPGYWSRYVDKGHK